MLQLCFQPLSTYRADRKTLITIKLSRGDFFVFGLVKAKMSIFIFKKFASLRPLDVTS